MRDKIKARFKAKFPKVNLSDARLDSIADKLAPKITDENDIDDRLDSLNDVLSFEDIAKQDDKVRKLESKQKPTPEPQPDPKPADPAPADDTATMLKTLLEKIGKLEAKEQTATIQQQLAGHDKLKGVPASYWNKRALPATAEAIDAFADEVEADYTAFRQDEVNNGLGAMSKPVMGTPGKDGVSSGVQEYIAAKTNPTAAGGDLGGKKL